MGLNNNIMENECNNIRKYFGAFIENKASEAQALSIKKHIDKCEECSNEFSFVNETINSFLKDDGFVVNPELEKRILNSIENNSSLTKTDNRFFLFSVKIAATIAAAIIGTNIGVVLGGEYQKKKENQSKVIAIFANDLVEKQEYASNNILFTFLKNK